MNLHQSMFTVSRCFGLVSAIIFTLLASGCDNSNGDSSSNLASCADTSSCSSNPPVEIGETRPAQVQVPSDYTTTTRYPLLIVLHGFGADGNLQAFYFGLYDRVDSRQYVLVVPDGTMNAGGARFWNATPACCAFSEEDAKVDDVAYIRSLIEEAAATYSIDTSRIGLIGHSNGGFMALRMACEASDLVTAVVSLAGSTFADDSSCAPAIRPVSVLALHGDADETISYDGSSAVPGAIETIDRFAAHAGCDTAKPIMLPNIDVIDSDSTQGAEAMVLSYADCAEGVDVELWTLVGAPHIPAPYAPGALDSLVDWLVDHPRP